jgi:hypothetical protein
LVGVAKIPTRGRCCNGLEIVVNSEKANGGKGSRPPLRTI